MDQLHIIQEVCTRVSIPILVRLGSLNRTIGKLISTSELFWWGWWRHRYLTLIKDNPIELARPTELHAWRERALELIRKERSICQSQEGSHHFLLRGEDLLYIHV